MTSSKSTKRALVSGVMAIVLCLAMLIGTTFAWFTDSASTAVNKIQAGKLDVQLLDENGNSLEGQTLTWKKAADGANQAVLWEPGCTYELQPIVIKNAGNLALKYKIVISGIQGDAALNNAIEWTITNTSTVTALDADHALAAGASDTLTIKGHMREDAGNEYQRLSIDGIGITVVATQYTYESDSNNNQYDVYAEYPVISNADFADAIENVDAGSVVDLASGTFQLPSNSIPAGVTITGAGKENSVLQVNNGSITSNDVTIKNIAIKGSGASGTSGSLNISGNNTTIENVNYKGQAGKIAIAVSTGDSNSGTVIKDTKITNAFRGIQFWRLSGNSVIDNCVLDISGYTFNIDAVAPNSTLTVKDSTLNGWTSYTSGIELVTFDNCKFGLHTYEYLRPYSNTVLTDCEFTSAGYQLNAGGSDAYTITLNNCTKNGTAITAGNVVSLLLDTEDWNSNVTLIVNGVTVTV